MPNAGNQRIHCGTEIFSRDWTASDQLIITANFLQPKIFTQPKAEWIQLANRKLCSSITERVGSVATAAWMDTEHP
jgi:hypothetical protein